MKDSVIFLISQRYALHPAILMSKYDGHLLVMKLSLLLISQKTKDTNTNTKIRSQKRHSKVAIKVWNSLVVFGQRPLYSHVNLISSGWKWPLINDSLSPWSHLRESSERQRPALSLNPVVFSVNFPLCNKLLSLRLLSFFFFLSSGEGNSIPGRNEHSATVGLEVGLQEDKRLEISVGGQHRQRERLLWQVGIVILHLSIRRFQLGSISQNLRGRCLEICDLHEVSLGDLWGW